MLTNHNFHKPLLREYVYVNLFRFSMSSKIKAMSKLAKSEASSLVKGKAVLHLV